MLLPEACVNLVLIRQRCKPDQVEKMGFHSVGDSTCTLPQWEAREVYILARFAGPFVQNFLTQSSCGCFFKIIFGFTFFIASSFVSYVHHIPCARSYLRALRFPEPVFFDPEDRKGEEWLQREVQESPTTTGGAEASVGVPGLNQINPRYLGVHFEDDRISEFEGWYLIRF